MKARKSGIECAHFGHWIHGQTFDCSKVGETTESQCLSCPHHTPLVLEFTFAAGITTAPRQGKYPYLDKVLDAYEKSGFPQPRLYDDADKSLGAWGNFHRAALDLHLRFPHASAYLILQDDTLLAEGSADAVKSFFGVCYEFSIASLYIPPSPRGITTSTAAGWRRIDRGWNSPGACAYVFAGWALRDLLCYPPAYWHRRFGPTGGSRGTDSVVGMWAGKFGGIWYPAVPLAEHVGEVSAWKL
jgi:hypothetical protein